VREGENMNPFSNIWNHPKTTVAGLLISVITIAGVLSQQGVTLGRAGTGTIVALIAAIATALLGLLARDPASSASSSASSSSGVQKMGSLMLCALLLSGSFIVTIPATGCSESQVVGEINTVLTQATNVLAVVDPSNTALIADLQNGIAALKAAEASWQSGSGVQIVINALNTIEDITAVIPLTAEFSPLIDVLVAGIEVALNALWPSSTLTAAVTGTSPAIAMKAHTLQHVNPHKGRVTLSHPSAKAFKAQWNAVAKANPRLAAAVIN
jgi:hypothetical protein